MTTKEMISAIVHAKHGWAVAEQFDVTWDREEEFEEQNGNALRQIERVCADLLESGLLAEKPYYRVVGLFICLLVTGQIYTIHRAMYMLLLIIFSVCAQRIGCQRE